MVRPLVLLVALVATLVVLVAGAGPASAAAPELAVRDGRLVDLAAGGTAALQLRGVNRSGTEYACTSASDGTPGKRGYAIFDGPTYDSGLDVAQPAWTLDRMRSWGIDAVRVPLSDACWFGEGSTLSTRYTGNAYREAIKAYVRQLADHGMVAILSLHVASTTPSSNLGPQDGGRPVLLPMPQADQGPRFWSSVVQEVAKLRVRNVIYDAFNEPHLEDAVFPTGVVPDPWGCWSTGCELVDPTGQAPTYRSAGMAQLVATIRTQERNNGLDRTPAPIMLGGIDYANDLSGWSAHLPTDPAGALVASFHVYGGGDGSGPLDPGSPDGGGGVGPGTACNDEPCWRRTVDPIAAGDVGRPARPVVTGEVGQYDCRSGFTRAYMGWADRRPSGPVSYLAWTWNAMYRPDVAQSFTGWRCDAGPTLVRDNQGTPTDAYGLGVCQHLRARAAADGVLPAGDPCPAGRAPTEPPADAVVATTPTAPDPPASNAGPPATSEPPTSSAPATPVPAPVPLPPTSPPTAGQARTATVTSRTVRVRRGRAVVAVRCAAGRTPCAGRVRLRTRGRVALGGRRPAVRTLLSVSYRLRAGTSATLRATPTRDATALLRRVRRLAAVAMATSAGGAPVVRRVTVSR